MPRSTIVCYSCQQQGHISRNCRNKRVSTQGWRPDSTRKETSTSQERISIFLFEKKLRLQKQVFFRFSKIIRKGKNI